MQKEADAAVRRNAFLGLIHVDVKAAINYMTKVADQLPTFDDLTQMAAIELIRQDVKRSSQNKVYFAPIPCRRIAVKS